MSEFRTEVVVRWSDMDAYGHVNHARTVTLLEEARVDMLFAPGSPTATLATGAVVADVHVRYHRQLSHADSPLEVRVWISRLRGADATFSYEVRPAASPGAVPAVTATTQVVAFDLTHQRPRRLTPAERAAFEGWTR